VIIMKAYDDDNQEVGRLIKTHDQETGQSSFAFDCSAVGSTECDVELFDSSGASLATVRVPNGTSFTFADADADCPGGIDNQLRMALLLPAVQKIREARCAAIDSLALPDGSAVSDVKSYTATPVAPVIVTSGRRPQLRATATYSDGTGSLIITGVSFAPRVLTDFDGDGDVDQSDFGVFQACASGPAMPAPDDCDQADLDSDGDVDQSDFGVFQRCLSGPDVPADAGCEN